MLRYCIFALFVGLPTCVWAQKYATQNKTAIRYYEKAQNELKRSFDLYSPHTKNRAENRYDEAAEYLEKAIRKDPKFVEAHLELARIYEAFRFQNPKYFEKYIYHYEQAVKAAPQNPKNIEPTLTLMQYYLAKGDYNKTQKYAEQLAQFPNLPEKIKQEAEFHLKIVTFAKEQMQNPLDFKPTPLPATINRKDFIQEFPFLTADQEMLVFTAVPKNKLKERTGEDIWVSLKKNGEWSEPQPISSRINSPANEGTCAISADGRTIVFASCQGRQSLGSCDLYISEKIGEEWTEPVNLGPKINSPDWDSQPSLSADGKVLYFVSDRNKRNKNDIFVSYRNASGEWSQAVPLPAPINTPKDEFSPFIHPNGKTLFFASNGHVGMGGIDLFYSEKKIDGSWSEPKNLGYPINNYLDQVSLFVTADGKKGYYADRKINNYGLEENSILMEFEMPPVINISTRTHYVKGKVTDEKTLQPLDAYIDLINLATGQKESFTVSDKIDGSYLLVLNERTEYALEIRKNGYVFKSLRFDLSQKSFEDFQPIELNITLAPIEKGRSFVLNNIFFDTGKWELGEKSRAELDELAAFMQDNPQVKGEIAGHTDNVGEKKANMELSLKRARAVYDYLVAKGIDPQRLTYKGYGDTRPAVPNDSEENRQLNRRIEFKFL